MVPRAKPCTDLGGVAHKTLARITAEGDLSGRLETFFGGLLSKHGRFAWRHSFFLAVFGFAVFMRDVLPWMFLPFDVGIRWLTG
jgi:hypothetical protein